MKRWYWPNGTLRREGSYVDGEKDGHFVSTSPYGVVTSVSRFAAGVPLPCATVPTHQTALSQSLCGLLLASFVCSCAPTTAAPTTSAPTARAAAPLPSRLRYEVRARLGALSVDVCGAPPTAIGPVDARARAFAQVSERGGCLHYDLDLAAVASSLRSREAAVDAGDGVVLASPDVWLWTTGPPYPEASLLLSVDDGVAVTLPFATAGEAADPLRRAYFVDPTTWRFLSAAVFGPAEAYERRSLAVGDAAIEVAVLPGTRALRGVELDRWIGAAAAAVATGAGARGGFPVPRATVVVQPVWGDGVPFGMVTRGGGAQVLLLLGEHARLADIIDGWVVVHELSHLLHPALGGDDAWLGEGYASYQQHVLRARAGLLTEAEAWAGLADGLARGARSAGGAVSLAQASARMRAEARWLQVYWGGAAIALWLDVELRRCGAPGLDDVVRDVRVAAAKAARPKIDASEVVAVAAARAAEGGDQACADLAGGVRRMLNEPFPSASRPLLEALGVRDGALDDAAPLAAVRRRITARRDVTW